jgi:pSer/pThr/pTyr-binding forkhead associated (FHA) protein
MFAVEIQFPDGALETVLVRRPLFRIGGAESCHLIVDEMTPLNLELEIARDLGRQFRVKQIPISGDPSNADLFESYAKFKFGEVTLSIIALDSDLQVRETEPPDRAGVRILRFATTNSQPKFPALLIIGPTQLVISFDKSHPVYLGRARQSTVRLDNPDISGQHARIGFENNEFWVEDLGSTNGTFVNQQQISGRVTVPPVVPIVLGEELSVLGIVSEQQLRSIERSALGVIRTRPQTERKYPILISVSEVARPARLVIPATGSVQVGRDPTSDMWLGAPHISRAHCSIRLDEAGRVLVTDQSTNGTGYDRGLLRRGETLELTDNGTVFDFGGGVTLAVCFSEAQEQTFILNHGQKSSFTGAYDGSAGTEPLQTLMEEILDETQKGFEESVSSDDRRVRERKPTGTFQALHIAYGRSGREGKLIVALAILALLVLILIGVVLLRSSVG